MKELQLSKKQEDRAMALHKKAIIADMTLTGSFAHPALVVNGKSYLDRALAGGLTVAALTMGQQTPNFRKALEDVNLHHRLLRQEPDKLLLATRSEDFRRAKEEGKIGLVLAFQNATPLEDDWLNLLPVFYALGVRVIQLTYNETNLLGSGWLEPVDIGLTAYGRHVVRAMNSMGVIVDLSHVGDKTAMQAIELSEDPVLMTHANPRALNPSPRNKPDDIIKAVAEKGGVICCVAYAPLCETKKGVHPTIFDFVDHIEYVANLVGIDHVGISSDNNENFRASPIKSSFETIYSFTLGPYKDGLLPFPKEFAFVDDYPNLTRALVARGYSDSDILKILGENVLRVVAKIWDRHN
jgi:membrane dipeptidase